MSDGPDDPPGWSENTKYKIAIMRLEKSWPLDYRDVRGIYVDEKRVKVGGIVSNLVCKIIGHHANLKPEPMLNVHRQLIGIAEWCPRCGSVVSKNEKEEWPLESTREKCKDG